MYTRCTQAVPLASFDYNTTAGLPLLVHYLGWFTRRGTMSCCETDRLSGLHETIRVLPGIGWYYGNITVQEAERLLRDEPDGAFLVRDSTDAPGHCELYTITFKTKKRCGSVRVDYSKGYFTLSLQDPGLPLFRTLMDLVGYCCNRSVVHRKPVCILTGHLRNRNVLLYLIKPVSRFSLVHSLQHCCRNAIHKYVTLDKISQLNLPKYLLENYVSFNPLYDEQLHPTDDDTQSQVSTCSDGSCDLEVSTN